MWSHHDTNTHTHARTLTYREEEGGGLEESLPYLKTLWVCVAWLSDRRDDKVSPQTVFSGQKSDPLPLSPKYNTALLPSSSQKQLWDLPHI